MKLQLHSVYKLLALSLFCVIITVSETSSTFVPGLRCMCPETQDSVRGQLTDLKVIPSGTNCDRTTVIVVLKRNNAEVCLNPQSQVGKMLVRCWNRANKLDRSVKLCLKRRRKNRQHHQKRPRHRNGGHRRRATSPTPTSSP